MQAVVHNEGESPLEIFVTLEAHEVELLARGSWKTLARILNASESDVADVAERMLTRRETTSFVQELVLAKASEQACAACGVDFVLTPRARLLDDAPFDEHAGLRFVVQAFPVPTLDLDLDRPIAQREGETAEAAIRRALTARINGVVPEALVDANYALKKTQFQNELAEQGITYRAYRIQHGVKPHDVESALADEALSELLEDIALDLVFFRKGLRVEEADERAALAAFGIEDAARLKRDLAETGRTHLFAQKNRRACARRWVAEHLVQRP